MRFIISYFVLSVLILSIADSQYAIEFQGGTNIANLSNPGHLAQSATWTTRLGFVGEALTTFTISNDCNLQTGLRFIQKGTKANFDFINSTVTINYVELPIYAQYQLGNFSPRLFIVAGPAFSYLTNAYMQGTSSIYGSYSHSSIEQFQSYDISLDAGLSLRNPISEHFSVVGSAMYSNGFVKIDKVPDSNEKTRDVRIAIGFAYIFQ
jgi:hypothetical protein